MTGRSILFLLLFLFILSLFDQTRIASVATVGKVTLLSLSTVLNIPGIGVSAHVGGWVVGTTEARVRGVIVLWRSSEMRRATDTVLGNAHELARIDGWRRTIRLRMTIRLRVTISLRMATRLEMTI